MSILIETVRISGFRGIKHIEIFLSRITVLIGTNNAGKTSVIKAVELALGDYSRYLTEEDFHIGTDGKRVDKITIDIKIVPMDSNGNEIKLFDTEWQTEFGDKIKSEANGNQFVAIRACSEQNITKGSFETNYSTLDIWPAFEKWLIEKVKITKFRSRFQSLPLISVEAQRDIHQDLRDKSSFVGKILTSIEYDRNDILLLESHIKEINDTAVSKSSELNSLKSHLEKLNQSIGGTNSGAEITPFPKKIRDLSKNFSIYFGETENNSFSMEYHGMGTRSWASMLTIKSFFEILRLRREQESEPTFPVFTVEEPEAHLHPNAQRTIYNQLSNTDGQLILSTHSPFLAAMADFDQIRVLERTSNGVIAHGISHKMAEDEEKSVRRNVLAKNGELLFAKCALLCEGMTEEQVIPAMIEIYFEKSTWNLGISCVNVAGKKSYKMFMNLVCSLGIPTSIISDCDGDTKKDVDGQINEIKKLCGVHLTESNFNISYHGTGNDFEAELIAHGLRDEIIEALVLFYTKGTPNEQYQRETKLKELNALNDEKLIEEMRKKKTSYAGFLVDVLLENKNNKSVNQLVPPNIRANFDCIKRWLAC